MYELSIVRKYLIPKKKQLSVALIATMSIVVISLVVWLLLVFLSVTEGIEKSWLQKVTSLNAPIRITPTEHYYNSYYYLIDEMSSSSNYCLKSIAAKKECDRADPYDGGFDGELPPYFPLPDLDSDGKLKDPIKAAFACLKDISKKDRSLVAEEYETSGALMRLELIRPQNAMQQSHQYLTQVSYLSSLPEKNPRLKEILLPPTIADIDNLIYLSQFTPTSSVADTPTLAGLSPSLVSGLNHLLNAAEIKEMRTKASWKLPIYLLPDEVKLSCHASFAQGKIAFLCLHKYPKTILTTREPLKGDMENGFLEKKGNKLTFVGEKSGKIPLSPAVALLTEETVKLRAEPVEATLSHARGKEEIFFRVEGALQGISLKGDIPWSNLYIAKATPKIESRQESLPWLYQQISDEGMRFVLPKDLEKGNGVLLAKNFQDQGVLIGDRGYFAYPASSLSASVEQRIPIFVAGFYDPGVIGIGGKFILTSDAIAHAINASGSSYSLDKTLSNGIHVWFDDLSKSDEIKNNITHAFAKAGIDRYWKVTSYKEYDFVKDLLQQFQSDKYLFSIVGIIILIVACCNIISLLILLVNDKKKEIAILQSLGASPLSIAAIFGLSGTFVGIFSTLIGGFAAMVTLKNIDSVVGLLSFLQGHDAFNALFFGKSLPNYLSSGSILFIFIATPLLSLLAGLIPAIKACKIKPASILRAE
jgi:lipoprotein-releasing system permease protein